MIKKHQGFSLLELLITFSIITIILGLTLPSHSQFLSKTKQTIASEQLLQAIKLTREEALLRGVNVTLCKSANHQNCGGTWQAGYIIFVDKTHNGVVNDQADVLYVFNAHEGVLNWRSSLNRDDLQMLPSGLSAGENGTFSYSPNQLSKPVWTIVVNQAGRARMISI